MYREIGISFYVAIDTKTGTKQAFNFDKFNDASFIKETEEGIRVYELANHPDHTAYGAPPVMCFLPETHSLFNVYRFELSDDKFDIASKSMMETFQSEVAEQLWSIVRKGL